jgi:hypothetical protein
MPRVPLRASRLIDHLNRQPVVTVELNTGGPSTSMRAKRWL